MTSLKYTAATLALLLTTSLGYAQDSSTTAPQTGATVNCPAAGSVPESDLPAECQDKAGKSTTLDNTQDGGTATAPKATTELPKTEPEPRATGTAETPKTDPSTTTATGDDATAPAVATSTSVLASQFIGQTVYSATNENVGEINDLVMSKELDNVMAVIGVGGFLGIGEKDVAIPISNITVTKDQNNALHLSVAATKEALEAAPVFDRTAMK